MKKSKHTATTDQTAEIADELYDVLMGEIEPELTHAMLPTLAELYEDETPEEATERARHYEWAFKQFASLWGAFVEDVQSQLERVQEYAFAHAKTQAAKEESTTLTTLESEIQNT